MNHKEIINKYRVSGQIIGIKPAIVHIRRNKASLFKELSGNYIMSIKGNMLYFQRLSVVFKNLMPNLDIHFNLLNFKEYQLVHINPFTSCLYMAQKKVGFVEIFVSKGTHDTYVSYDSLLRMIKDFEKIGITEIKVGDINEDEAVDSKREGTN